jgi:hypothetical protein
MGEIKHHAIIVTATYGEPTLGSRTSGEERHWAEIAYRQAIDIFGSAQVTTPTPSLLNATRSFLVAPDGSKEGWEDSDEGDQRREEFVEWLRGQAYDDGSSPLAWIELYFAAEQQFMGDFPGAEIVRGSHERDRA